MIKCNKGCSEIKGSTSELLSDYSVITMHLRKALTDDVSEEYAKSMLKRSFDLGMMTEKELDKEYEEARRKSASTGLGMIQAELFGGTADDPD